MPEHTIAENLSRLVTAKTDIANAITTMGGVVGEGNGLEDFPADILGIPNRYGSSDEGKVVYNGSLVAQSTATRTTNGTVDTTRIKSLTVNVPVGETPINGTVTGYGIASSQSDSFAIQKGTWVLIYAYLGYNAISSGTKLFDVNGLSLPSTNIETYFSSKKYAIKLAVNSVNSITATAFASYNPGSGSYGYFFLLMR